LSVPLPLFGQRGVAVDAAQADLETLTRDTEVVRREARWAATLAWLEVWEAGALAQLLERAAQDGQRVAAIAADKYEVGKGAKLDVLRTAAERERAQADAKAGRLAERAAAARLSVLVGTELQVSTAEGAPRFVTPDAQALERHPTLVRDRADIVAAEDKVRLEQRLRWPNVAAQVTVNAFDPTLPGPDVQLGLSFDVPILNRRGWFIERARSVQRTAEMNAAIDARRLRAAFGDASARSDGARLQLETLSTTVLPALLEARALTLEGFQLGTLDLLRVLDAQRALSEARQAEVAARANWARAMADVERAVGTNLEGVADAP
jgi:cobalt-zinc-cadmium efflux system outer membrane protein